MDIIWKIIIVFYAIFIPALILSAMWDTKSGVFQWRRRGQMTKSVDVGKIIGRRK